MNQESGLKVYAWSGDPVNFEQENLNSQGQAVMPHVIATSDVPAAGPVGRSASRKRYYILEPLGVWIKKGRTNPNGMTGTTSEDDVAPSPPAGNAAATTTSSSYHTPSTSAATSLQEYISNEVGGGAQAPAPHPISPRRSCSELMCLEPSLAQQSLLDCYDAAPASPYCSSAQCPLVFSIPTAACPPALATSRSPAPAACSDHWDGNPWTLEVPRTPATAAAAVATAAATHGYSDDLHSHGPDPAINATSAAHVLTPVTVAEGAPSSAPPSSISSSNLQPTRASDYMRTSSGDYTYGTASAAVAAAAMPPLQCWPTPPSAPASNSASISPAAAYSVAPTDAPSVLPLSVSPVIPAADTNANANATAYSHCTCNCCTRAVMMGKPWGSSGPCGPALADSLTGGGCDGASPSYPPCERQASTLEMAWGVPMTTMMVTVPVPLIESGTTSGSGTLPSPTQLPIAIPMVWPWTTTQPRPVAAVTPEQQSTRMVRPAQAVLLRSRGPQAMPYQVPTVTTVQQAPVLEMGAATEPPTTAPPASSSIQDVVAVPPVTAAMRTMSMPSAAAAAMVPRAMRTMSMPSAAAPAPVAQSLLQAVPGVSAVAVGIPSTSDTAPATLSPLALTQGNVQALSPATMQGMAPPPQQPLVAMMPPTAPVLMVSRQVPITSKTPPLEPRSDPLLPPKQLVPTADMRIVTPFRQLYKQQGQQTHHPHHHQGEPHYQSELQQPRHYYQQQYDPQSYDYQQYYHHHQQQLQQEQPEQEQHLQEGPQQPQPQSQHQSTPGVSGNPGTGGGAHKVISKKSTNCTSDQQGREGLAAAVAVQMPEWETWATVSFGGSMEDEELLPTLSVLTGGLRDLSKPAE